MRTNIEHQPREDFVMTNADAIKTFADMLKSGQHLEAAAAFNAPDIVSIEAMDGPMARIEGAAAVKAKSDWWYGAHEVHSATAEGPYVNGDQFAMRFTLDVTARETGQRMQMTEIGLYTMKDGKVAEERFYY
jgi:ketosteroid isomerase-like protein